MDLQLSQPDSYNAFTHIERGSFGVNGFRYVGNIAVLPTEILTGWTSASVATLCEDDFAFIAQHTLDIVLLGTGSRLVFPPRQLIRPLHKLGRGVEIMDTPAACRTFNILVAEGRKVGAFLLVE